MNNKLFTSISIQEQENTLGGADVPAIYTFPDGSAIPSILTSPLTLINGIQWNNLLNQILPTFGYNLPIPSSFGF